MKKIISLCVGLFFFNLLLAAVHSEISKDFGNVPSEIVVNEVKIYGNIQTFADIVVNGCLKIKEIKVLKIGGENKLKFPTYYSRLGREYPQVVVHTKQANEAILQAIRTSKVSQDVKPLSYKVTEISPYNRESKLKAFVAVTFNDAITVECKIMSGKKGLWVAWPARKTKDIKNPWVKQVVILDKNLKDEIEKQLFIAYQEKIE